MLFSAVRWALRSANVGHVTVNRWGVMRVVYINCVHINIGVWIKWHKCLLNMAAGCDGIVSLLWSFFAVSNNHNRSWQGNREKERLITCWRKCFEICTAGQKALSAEALVEDGGGQMGNGYERAMRGRQWEWSRGGGTCLRFKPLGVRQTWKSSFPWFWISFVTLRVGSLTFAQVLVSCYAEDKHGDARGGYWAVERWGNLRRKGRWERMGTV